jgi:hypothetical protein
VNRHWRPIANWDILTPEMLAKLPSQQQVVLFKTRARSVRWAPLADVTRIPFERCLPVRLPGWHRRRGHLPDWYWFAKTNTLVLHESQLEKAQLILLDFDLRVRFVVAQPLPLAFPSAPRCVGTHPTTSMRMRMDDGPSSRSAVQCSVSHAVLVSDPKNCSEVRRA